MPNSPAIRVGRIYGHVKHGTQVPGYELTTIDEFCARHGDDGFFKKALHEFTNDPSVRSLCLSCSCCGRDGAAWSIRRVRAGV